MQGRLLELLARIQGARTILELGTLGGYSTIWLARALPPDGRLVTLELDAGYADVARANVMRAGLADAVEVRVGRALDTLAALAADGAGPFDLVFIDADKAGNAEYLAAALDLSRPGTLSWPTTSSAAARCSTATTERRRHQALLRCGERGAAPQSHRDPDGRGDGLRRLRTGGGALEAVSIPRLGGLKPGSELLQGGHNLR
jgi:protein-L-isoaspartate O-methyltransferase